MAEATVREASVRSASLNMSTVSSSDGSGGGSSKTSAQDSLISEELDDRAGLADI